MAKKASPKGGKKKRTVSGKRGTPTHKRRAGGTDSRGVAGIVVTCVGILAFVGQFISSGGGLVKACNDLVRGLGGVLCLLLPIVVCWAGLVLVFSRERKMSARTMVCGALLFLFVEALLQLFQVNAINASLLADGGAVGYGAFLRRSYVYATQDWSRGGGLIGALLAWPLVQALDIWGAVIVLLFAGVIVLMVLTGVSTGKAGMALSGWLDDLRSEISERREERRALRAAQEDEELEREAELAEQRRQKRAEREQARREAEEAPAPEPPHTAPAQQSAKRTKKAEPAPAAKGAPSARAPRESGELYIERDEEFQRAGIDERTEERASRRRGQFTLEEAEQAFLHGMEGARYSGYGDAPQPPAPEEAPEEGEPQTNDDSDNSYDAPEMEETPAGDEPPKEDESYDAPAQAQPTAPAPRAMRPAPAEGAQETGETITQLRGNRMDGTPIVMPAKDEHEAPKPAPVYNYPPLELLNRSKSVQDVNQRAKDEAGAAKLLETLESFGVQARLTHVTHGPAITRYEVQPAPGVKVSRIVGLVDDIALNMASDGVRIEAPIPGKPAVGIEIPNERIETVSLRDVLESGEMAREKSPTAVALGKGISGAPVIADMAKMPHVLIAGATGSGKSVCINTIINSIIFRASPREVRLILIDPKVVELSVYNGIPHLLVPVVTDPKKASAALSWAVVEMEHRYKRFESVGVRDIAGYNRSIGADEEPMSKIIVIIDELADLMMVAPGEVEESICRLAQLARAAGIHLVIATQRPSVNVITGVIKANIPSRIAFAVSSQIDSRTILDAGGAEKLLGKGDMLYAPQGAGKPIRVQGCFVSDEEVQRIVDHVRGQHEADYNEDVIEQMNTVAEEEKPASGADAPAGGEAVDEMLQKAIELAIDAGQVSISMLQRRLRVGYARAGRLVDEMTLRGITAEAEGPTKPRAVLITREEWRRMQENAE